MTSNSGRWRLAFVLFTIWCLSFPEFIRAETATFSCVADTCLFENDPENNLGFNPTVAAGTTASSKRSRALFRFDIAAALPPGAVIVTS